MSDYDDLLEFIRRTGGYSVTAMVRKAKQPRGGYLPPKTFTAESLGAGIEELDPAESTHSGLVGTAVDYLTRIMMGSPAQEVFRVSYRGSRRVQKHRTAEKLMADVKGLDRDSIINAVKLAGFDVVVRAGRIHYRPIEDIMPDEATINNIVIMVNRCLHFFDRFGPIVMDGITFEGGYTDVVSSGDGDYLTADSIWDFKVSKDPIKKEHTLQLLMYWIMGLHSIHPEYRDIKYLGIYNPRLNMTYRIDIKDIPEETINLVSKDVLCYKDVE